MSQHATLWNPTNIQNFFLNKNILPLLHSSRCIHKDRKHSYHAQNSPLWMCCPVCTSCWIKQSSAQTQSTRICGRNRTDHIRRYRTCRCRGSCTRLCSLCSTEKERYLICLCLEDGLLRSRNVVQLK